jgi:hypothetical protein
VLQEKWNSKADRRLDVREAIHNSSDQMDDFGKSPERVLKY